MKDRIIIPTFSRPEMLWLCLEHLEKCPEIRDVDVYVYLDQHTDKPGAPLSEVIAVIDNFSFVTQLVVRTPHRYHGNSYNVLMAYKEAYEDGCERVCEIEDDVLVEPDFLRWQMAAMREPKFAYIGSRNEHPVGTVAPFNSLGIGYPRETLRKIVEHCTREYFADMVGYCARHLPTNAFGSVYAEQDGLIRRLLIYSGQEVAWAEPPVARHVGWYGYNRSQQKRPNGTLEERYRSVRQNISNTFSIQ